MLELSHYFSIREHSPNLGVIMQLLSPSMLRTYLECPRSFYLIYIKNYRLVPPNEKLNDSLFTYKANQFLIRYSSLIENDKYSRITDWKDTIDDELTGHLYQKVNQVFRYFLHHLKNTRNFIGSFRYSHCNLIQSADHFYQGRPTTIIFSSSQSTAIFIHEYRNEFLQTKGFERFQALIYASILKSHNCSPEEFLYVNYKTGTLVHDKILLNELEDLENFTGHFTHKFEEGKYIPAPSSPCEYCEFELICKKDGFYDG